jgi:hypothetical protein
MAMDDVYRLVQAVLIDARMTRPVSFDAKNRPVGPWMEAEILNASVVGDHKTGTFNGHVWYRIKEGMNQDATFHHLWLEGWTTFEWREHVRPRRKRRAHAR